MTVTCPAHRNAAIGEFGRPVAPVGRLLNCLALLDTALRKLPTIMARTPRPQHLPEVVEQYNADIGPIAVGIRNIMCVIWHEIMIRIRYVVSDTDSFMFFVIQAMLNN